MAETFSFTEAKLRALEPPAKGRSYVKDTQLPGLQVCVTAAGSKTFYFVKRIEGKPTRVRIARVGEVSLSDARIIATAKAVQIAEGKNPVLEARKQREQPTLQDLFDHWLEVHAKRHKKTWRDDKRIFNKYFGTLKTKRLGKITRATVQVWHSQLGKDRGPYQANRCRALLSSMFGTAADLGYTGGNPCVGVKKFPERSRERFLLPDEMKRFFQALAEEEPIWRDFFLLLLFCGARRSNVAAMEWAQLDLDAAAWYLAGQDMKGGESIVVVLPEPAQAVLRARLEASDGSPYVFPSSRANGHIADPRKAWARVVKRAKIDNLRMHDLRRSLGSWQAAMGASLPIIGKSLGHRDHKATLIYSRLQLDPVKQSVEGAVAGMIEAGKITVDANGLQLLTDDREGDDGK